jgi:hypothetical protein
MESLLKRKLIFVVLHEHRQRAFENMVLKRIFGLKRDEIQVGWRKLHNDELHNLYSLLNMIRMIKSRMMSSIRPVACTRKKKRCIRFDKKS